MYNKKRIQQTNLYEKTSNKSEVIKNIYWAEVISIEDKTDGGRIKTRISGIDNNIENENLIYCYPLLPKFFHVYPQVGELVRILIEDVRYPQKNRFWIGNIISQLHKTNFDGIYSALSTTSEQKLEPDTAPSKFIEAEGIYPEKRDIAILGRKNTDLIFKDNDVEIRAGKHIDGNNLKLNKENPASIRLSFDTSNDNPVSKTLVMSDKIALISHSGEPKFKASQLTQEDINNIIDQSHPLGRADVIVAALELIRKAIIQHSHPYDRLSADKTDIIENLEKIDFTSILQENIVIN